MLPSLKVPVAVNCKVVPFAIDELLALRAINRSVAAVTDSAKEFEITPTCVAVMLLDPTATPVARPLELMLTVAGLKETHVAVFVRF